MKTRKIKGKQGGDSNESRFWTNDKELRARKSIIIPGASVDGYLVMEQAWNEASKKKDVVKLTLKSHGLVIGHVIVTREELEQGIMMMAQGAEILKYNAPTPYEDDLKIYQKKQRVIA